ncbi:hypothetical protein RRG08_015031 [Elysia crispata]|uniref:Solute-binding protein family 3/N-terminal domain-containing protein n=1 Tax=Elysia crispata TaxID=231223 RepID=A0AAE1B5J3_9GAST|nr:hypothetical protein RRG08_015031 [Elysia crispata]
MKRALDPRKVVWDGKGQGSSERRNKHFRNELGTLVGFDVELVTRVCSLVGKQCKMIMLPFTECIFTYKDIDYAGRGLSSQWVDGCPSYAITTDRRTEFDFTLPYLATTSSFTVAPGNPSGFDPTAEDYSAFTLVRLSGAPTNGACLNRLRKKYGKFIIAKDLPEAKAILLNGTADVLFSPRTQIDGLETLRERVHCDDGGAGILLRKGSDLATWWNPAFQTFYFSGQYAQMCEDASQKYGAEVQCLPTPGNASSELLNLMKADPPAASPDHLWKFVVSGKIEPFSFLDSEGNLIGWTKDFIQEVCSRADKRCHLMLAQVSECTTRDGELLYPGRGLMEGWFDACTGYFETLERDNSWDFTAPYLLSNASFYVKPGNPSKFDPALDDYSNFVLVRADTSITNDHCLNRLHKKFNKLLDVPTQYEAIAAVLNGTADAWFTKRQGETQLEELTPRFHCENVGTSIMTKKGSPLPAWWDTAFEEFYSTGEFNQFCLDKGLEYNYDFPCVPPRMEQRL